MIATSLRRRNENDIDFQQRQATFEIVIVCHCNRVNDRTIRAAICDGACSVGEIAEKCGAAACCGGCAPAVEEILAAEHRAVRRLPVLDQSAADHLAA